MNINIHEVKTLWCETCRSTPILAISVSDQISEVRAQIAKSPHHSHDVVVSQAGKDEYNQFITAEKPFTLLFTPRKSV